jgi:hypothetical protein
MKNFDPDYEIVDKKEIIKRFVNGDIDEKFYDSYFYIEISNGGLGVTNNLRNVTIGRILESVNNSNVVFLHKFAMK